METNWLNKLWKQYDLLIIAVLFCSVAVGAEKPVGIGKPENAIAHWAGRFAIAETLYYRGQYSEAEIAAKNIWQQTNSSIPQLFLWRAVALDARTAFQRNLPFDNGGYVSKVARFGDAVRMNLDEETKPKALRQLQAFAKEYPTDPFIQAIALSADSDLRLGDQEALGKHLQRLVDSHPKVSEVWEALFNHYKNTNNFSSAVEAGKKYIALETADMRSPLRTFEMQVMIFGVQLQTDKQEEAERQLTLLLQDKKNGTTFGRSTALLFFAIRAFSKTASLGSHKRIQRIHTMQVARRFFEAARDEAASLRSRSAEKLKGIVVGFLISNYDFSGDSLRTKH